MPRKEQVLGVPKGQGKRVTKKDQIMVGLEGQAKECKHYSIGNREPWKAYEHGSGMHRAALPENQRGIWVESGLYRRTHQKWAE